MNAPRRSRQLHTAKSKLSEPLTKRRMIVAICSLLLLPSVSAFACKNEDGSHTMSCSQLPDSGGEGCDYYKRMGWDCSKCSQCPCGWINDRASVTTGGECNRSAVPHAEAASPEGQSCAANSDCNYVGCSDKPGWHCGTSTPVCTYGGSMNSACNGADGEPHGPGSWCSDGRSYGLCPSGSAPPPPATAPGCIFDDGRGCPDGCWGHRGCCLGEYDGWCSDNYKSGFICENNACGDSDCCVPSSNTGAIVGIVIGVVILLVLVGVGVGLWLCMKNRASSAVPPAVPAGANHTMSSTSGGVALTTAPVIATAPVVGTAPVIATASVVSTAPVVATAAVVGAAPECAVTKLENLTSMLDSGLITQKDYDAKKAQILAAM